MPKNSMRLEALSKERVVIRILPCRVVVKPYSDNPGDLILTKQHLRSHSDLGTILVEAHGIAKHNLPLCLIVARCLLDPAEIAL